MKGGYELPVGAIVEVPVPLGAVVHTDGGIPDRLQQALVE